MPLPDRNQPWPPPASREADDYYTRWGAWYSGDPEQLAAAYSDMPGLLASAAGDTDGGKRGMPAGARFVGSLARGVQRMFWGTAMSAGQVRSHKLHIPLPGDIASTSADLLYGEPLNYVFDGEKKDGSTSTRLAEILEEANADAVLLEQAELGSAYGGAYVRIRIDPVLADCPLLDVIPPDTAVPEFRGGRLVAVTFWRNLPRPDGRWWRHLERHEAGKILHGLFVSGDEGKLGAQLPLDAHDETAPLAMVVDAGDGSTITTGAKGLTAEYFPNMRPNRIMRGSALGRSDYSGVEPMFDALDESWTSWMRDLRIGKGRLVVPRSYLRSRGRGGGASFDPEQEVYEAVDSLEGPGSGGGLAISNVQFAIRVDEHARTCQALVEQIVRAAGYSAQTFGADDGTSATATEVVSRDARSDTTRAKKVLYARGPIARLALALLQVDAAKFGSKKGVKTDERPKVTWPDGVAPDPEATARTLQMLKAAGAASTYTMVKLFNPDWEEAEILAEVDRIREDATAAMPQVPEPGDPGALSASDDALNGPQAGQDGGQADKQAPGKGQQPPDPRGRGNGPPTGKPAPAGPAGPGSNAKSGPRPKP